MNKSKFDHSHISITSDSRSALMTAIHDLLFNTKNMAIFGSLSWGWGGGIKTEQFDKFKDKLEHQ